jgi:SagB-type dehydrogenase family enzyme
MLRQQTSRAGTDDDQMEDTPATAAIDLPEPVLDSAAGVEQVLQERRSIRDYQDAALTVAEVGQLLWAAQGVTDPAGFRTAPSAGALYPLETYLVAGNVTGLADGIYRYSPAAHALTLVAEGDRRPELRRAALDQDSVADAAAVIALTGVYQRTAVKYGERSERYVHMEVGAAAQNVYLQATALGLGTVFIGAFRDGELRQVLQAGEDEQPLCLLPLGRPLQ